MSTTPSASVLAPSSPQAEIKAALLAILDLLTVAEPVQARLWHTSQITMTQLAVLRQLRGGPQTVGRLGSEAGISPASVTRLVDRLERRGLVARSRDAADRRRVDVRLTAEGERLLGESKVLRGSDLHRAVEAMTGEERSLMTSALRRFVELARELGSAEVEAS